jgi:tungstate transport system ATP-binding protein
VETNLRFGLRLRGIKDMKESIDRIMEELGLCELRHAAVSTLSGGEAQRGALSRALLLKPEVLLLDEPTANLDPYNVELIEKVIRRLNHSRQTTINLVTHNIFQAKRLADRVALLLNGEMIETAETAAFFENPKDPRALAFVRGEMVW